MKEHLVPKLLRGRAQFYRGLDSLEQWKIFITDHPYPLGMAFIGRSNVGKSSLINALYGKGVARTSNTPGRTRQINVFTFTLNDDPDQKPLFFFDLPGYGHAAVSKSKKNLWRSMIDFCFETIHPDSLLLQLQDARHPMQKVDEEFVSYAQTFTLAHYLTFNKIDKLKKQSERAQLEKIKPQIYKRYKRVEQIYFISAETYKGLLPLEKSLFDYFTLLQEKEKNKA